MPTYPDQARRIQDAATATGNGNNFSVGVYNVVAFTVTGTFSGTVTFECMNNTTSGTWQPLLVQQQSATIVSPSSTTTTTGLFIANVAGINLVRARISAYTSGSITVSARAENSVPTNLSGGATGTSSNQVQGAGASGASAVGNPVGVGGIYESTLPTLTNGQRGDLHLNNRTALLVDLYSKIAGEDITNDRLVTVMKFTAQAISTATTTTVKSGAGVLHNIIVTGGVAGTIIIYDNTAGSGTIIASFDSTATIAPYLFDASFTTGLTIVTASATKITVNYM